jgi:hypothetical protein
MGWTRSTLLALKAFGLTYFSRRTTPFCVLLAAFPPAP